MGLKFEAFFYFNGQGWRIDRGLLPPLRRRGPVQPTRNGKMILHCFVKLKELFEKERDYPWQKPNSCPSCNSCRLWGHGYAPANFDGFIRPLLLKLYRCPDCGCVVRLRPKGYFKRFQASIETIRSSIACKAATNRWIAGVERTRQCHWFRYLCQRIKVYLTDTWREGILAGFDHLLQLDHIPVSRAI
jgi:hypothetical protein